MPHRRNEIRKILVDALKNKTLAKEHVDNWRMRPVQNECHLPCISVVTPEEKATEISPFGDFISRQTEIIIDIYSATKNNEDILCDEIAAQVESIVNSINNTDFDFKYKKTVFTTEGISQKVLMICSLIYECNYNTYEQAKIEADDLEEISIEV